MLEIDNEERSNLQLDKLYQQCQLLLELWLQLKLLQETIHFVKNHLQENVPYEA